MLALSAAYVFIKFHTPLTIYTGAPHDDTLFLKLGRSLAEGQWLGEYNEYTLMKGPGYPFFLALTSWSGLPLSVSVALFHVAVVSFFTVVAHQFVRSYFLSGVLFVLLLFCPISLSSHVTRVIREQIYGTQVLLVLAALLAALFYPVGRKPYFHAALAGLAFGWFWLTREEGVWVLPAIVLLLAVGALNAFGMHRLRHFAKVIVVAVLVFTATQAAFRTMNWWYYGSFVGVDFKERHFQRALRAIHSVRSGGVKPYVSITYEGRQQIYAVSPTFTLLKYYLDGPSGAGWSQISCSVGQSQCNNEISCAGPCNELGAGFFIFALRHATSGIGMYATPLKAASFFKQLTSEVEDACVAGKLQCMPQPINEMPPVTWEHVRSETWIDIKRGIKVLSMFEMPGPVNGSSGEVDQIAYWLQFLNYPRYQPQTGEVVAGTYVMSGWYMKKDTGDWITVTVKFPSGRSAYSSVDRQFSPDLAPGASQRFTIRTRCNDQCTIRIEAKDGSFIERPLAEIKSAPIGWPFGPEGHAHVDDTRVQSDTIATTMLSDLLADRYRLRILKYYNYFFFPLMCLGILAFAFATLRHWRVVAFNVCYTLALASWGLVAARAGLLTIMAITSISPAVIQPLYASPAFFLLVTGTVFSLVALIQLSWRRERTA
ncbi:MAG: hypothetical protein QOF14_4356 [Hyphomicrobiales bacterium]|nr:hypothetical protein [Hyphomicrobiales bacterium]